MCFIWFRQAPNLANLTDIDNNHNSLRLLYAISVACCSPHANIVYWLLSFNMPTPSSIKPVSKLLMTFLLVVCDKFVGLICTKETCRQHVAHSEVSIGFMISDEPVHWSWRDGHPERKISRGSGTNSKAACVFVRVDSATISNWEILNTSKVGIFSHIFL